MLQSFLHLLLIPAVLGCPLSCVGGAGGLIAGCCEVSGGTLQKLEPRQPLSCCTGCHASDRELSPEEPAGPVEDRSEKHSCQCICGGAIIGATPETDEPLDISVGWISLADLPSLTLIGNLPGLEGSSPRQLLLRIGDRTALSGWQLRCLHSSLLF